MPRKPSISEFHIFNAHLKDVCSPEKYLTECPRTLTDLRNYDPPHFDKLNSKAKITYYFDEQGLGTLIVNHRGLIQVSDHRILPTRYKDFFYSTDHELAQYLR